MLDLFDVKELMKPIALYTLKDYTKGKPPFGILLRKDNHNVLRVGNYTGFEDNDIDKKILL